MPLLSIEESKIEKLTDYIELYPARLPADLCDSIVNAVELSNEFKAATIMSGEVNNSIRNVGITMLNRFPELDKRLYDEMNQIIADYATKHQWCSIERDEGYAVLRYAKGQHYAQHVDQGTGFPRTVSVICALNSQFTGGEFWLWDGALRYRLEKGDVFLWPSTFLYPHEIRPVESGTRYSIVSWFL